MVAQCDPHKGSRDVHNAQRRGQCSEASCILDCVSAMHCGAVMCIIVQCSVVQCSLV